MPAAGVDDPGYRSGKLPSAVFSTHLGQSPSGASEKILAPHFRQILITLIIVGVARALSLLYSVKFCHTLRLDHRNEMAQLVFDIAGCRNGVGNLLSQ